MRNTSLLTSSLPSTGFACPTNHGTTGNLGNCRNFSVPLLDNDVFWQNRSFDVGVGSLGTGTLNQQNVVSLYNGGTTTRAVNQPAADATTAAGGGVVITGGTGACVTPVTYWDLERMRWTSSFNRALSTCGPAGGGQLLGQTTLAPGAACVITVQFRPLTAEAAGVKTATLSVTDAAGIQSSTLTGTAQ